MVFIRAALSSGYVNKPAGFPPDEHNVAIGKLCGCKIKIGTIRELLKFSGFGIRLIKIVRLPVPFAPQVQHRISLQVAPQVEFLRCAVEDSAAVAQPQRGHGNEALRLQRGKGIRLDI